MFEPEPIGALPMMGGFVVNLASQ